jgi:hypothetical protein
MPQCSDSLWQLVILGWVQATMLAITALPVAAFTIVLVATAHIMLLMTVLVVIIAFTFKVTSVLAILLVALLLLDIHLLDIHLLVHGAYTQPLLLMCRFLHLHGEHMVPPHAAGNCRSML